jgi:serine/threonine protein kinase
VQPVVNYESNLSGLQASLDAYFDQHLEFGDLRTQWIITLAEKPEMRDSAVRLLYQQPSNRHLPEERALALKRVIETGIHDDPDDRTITLDEQEDTKSKDLPKSPGHDTETPAAAPTVRSGDTLVPGHVLKDRFVLEEQLGRGGIGIVYKAHDRLRQRTHAETAQIALKVLSGEYLSNPEMLNALQRAASQAQGLSHPNIVRVHDFHQDGETGFLTMELVDGELLRTALSRLRPATLPPKLAMNIIVGMSRGLAHAHANGLVHGDFKPGNVLLTADNKPKIFDFGLARVAAPGGQMSDTSPRPASKALRSITPAYSSCNRLEGGAPGFSDDVYSLSCVIYELLAGHHPYDRKSALVARELGLQPLRIKGLTDLQWRTLAMGLQPSREDRTTEVYDLGAAFTPEAPAPMQAMKAQIRRKRRRRGAVASVITAFLLGAGLVAAVALLGFQPIPSKYVDLVRDSTLVQTLQSALGMHSSDSTTAGGPAPEPLPDVEAGSNTAIASPGAPLPAAEAVETDTAALVREAAETLIVAAALQDAESELLTPPDDPSAAIDAPLPIIVPGFRLDSAEYYIQENATALAVQISRQGDLSNQASVEWTTFSDSAESQLDYGGFFRRLVQFAAGEETKTIFIPIVSDVTAESDESFQLALSRPGGDMILAHPFTATVIIIDDDF